MKHGALATFDTDGARWAVSDETTPAPFCTPGEAVAPDAFQPINDTDWTLIAGTVIDTQKSGHESVVFQVSEADFDVDVKLVAAQSEAFSRWFDVVGLDETGTPYGQATINVVADDTKLIIVPPGAIAGFRYFGLMHRATNSGELGTTTVIAFGK